MKVELVYEPSCPNIGEARAELSRAFAQLKRRARWKEWNVLDPRAPARVRGLGSPTILVDGLDVSEPGEAPAGASCRIYRDGTATRPAPSAQAIAAALLRPRRSRMWLATLPAVGSSLLPNVACPACWPAYAGLAGSMGLGFLLEAAYLLPLIAGFLLLALGALGYRAKTRRGYGPLLLGSGSAALVLIGKFGAHSDAVMYFGVASLLAASVWNTWPRRASSTCAVPSEV